MSEVISVSICTFLHCCLDFRLDSSNWSSSNHFGSYTQEHICQAADGKAPLGGESTAAEMPAVKF